MLYPPQYISAGRRRDGRLDPAEYVDVPTIPRGWYQAGARRKKVKPYYHLIWPKDKDRGKLGRLKDILQGKGPDIHLSISAQKNDHLHNRQLRGRWSNWPGFDRRVSGVNVWPGQFTLRDPFWVGDGSTQYNFFTRKYEGFHPAMWSDAIWQGPHKNSQWPDQYRDVNGKWRQDDGWDPRRPGQNMRNI